MKLRRLNVEFYDEILGSSFIDDLVRLNTIKIFLAYKICCSDEYELFTKTRQQVGFWGFPGVNPDASAPSLEDMHWFIRRCLNSGHTSPIEHTTLTFHISGFSRAGSHQLVRNRIASYTQQSQRSVSMHDMPVVCPTTIENHKNPEVFRRFKDTIQIIEDAYNFFISEDVPKEDARFISPQACTTALIATMNLRAWQNFFRERSCNRAQWEIRDFSDQALALCQKYYPFIFEDSGPKCYEHATCPEGPLMCKQPKFLHRESASTRRKARLKEHKMSQLKQ